MTRNEQIKEQLKELPKGTFDSVADYVTYCAGFYDGVTWADKTMIEKACKWLRNNWRNYVDVDSDGVVCFGHWENDFRKAMKGD